MLDDNLNPVHDAMDKSFRFVGDQWGEDFHIALGLPGNFKSLLQNDIAKNPKKSMRMDILEKVEIDEGFEILINIEHQSTVLDDLKIKMIVDYKNHSKCKHNLPLLSVIVSPYPKKSHKNQYKSTESDILQPIFITIDDEEIQKRLNILKNNTKNEKIPNPITLNIAIISIFIKNNNYAILKQLCEILKHSTGIKDKIKRDMTKILEEMIKYKLQNNEKQVMELLNMLEEEREIARRGVRIWYEEEFTQLEAKYQKELTEKDAEISRNNAQFQEVLAGKDAEINRNNAQFQEVLADKDRQILELKSMLKTNSLF